MYMFCHLCRCLSLEVFHIGVAVACRGRLLLSRVVVACRCRLSQLLSLFLLLFVACRFSLISVAVKIWISSRFVKIVILWDWLESVAGPKAS